MAEDVKGFAEHLGGVQRHWKIAAITFVVVMTIGVLFTASLKDIYRSTGYILIEESEIPEEIIRSTVTTYASRQVTELNERILTVSNLVRLIEEYDLYPDERKNTPAELLAINARNSIAVEIQTRDTVTEGGLPRPIAVGFNVSFEDTDPKKAQLVATELVELYMGENIKARSEQTSQTSDFLKGEVSRLEAEIGELESQLARFKEENAASLPSMSAVNQQQMNRMDGTLLEIDRRLAAIAENRITLKAQLSTVEPTQASRLADGSVVMAPADQLRALQTQLSVVESRYSDTHPDVLRIKRDIESIQNRFGLNVDLAELDKSLVAARADLAVARKRYSADHPDVVRLERSVQAIERQKAQQAQQAFEGNLKPDNPAYIALTSALDKISADEVSLLKEKAVMEQRMLDYERRLMETPQIEKELAALTRTLSSSANRYWVMRDKQFTAEMGETLETQSKGEELVLIEAPRVPLKPYKPDRGAILALSFLFALVCGLGITQLADALDKSIRGSAAVEAVQGDAPLIEVPYIYVQSELERERRLRKLGLAAAPAVAVVLAIIVHFAIQPLDVLFFSALQKLGL